MNAQRLSANGPRRGKHDAHRQRNRPGAAVRRRVDRGAEVIPAELIQPDEFHALTGSRQRATWRRWLDRIGVRYLQTPAGYPLVYRDRLLPAAPQEPSAAPINLRALHVSSRTSAKA